MRTLETILDATELFQSAGKMKQERFARKVISLMASDMFLRAIYNIDGNDSGKKQSALAEMYDAASKFKCVDAISEAINDYGFHHLNRSSAVFMVSLVNIGMGRMNQNAADIGRRRDHGDISEEMYQRHTAKLDAYQATLGELLNFARKIVDRDARILCKKSGLPLAICQSTLYTVPSAQYVGVFRLAYYLRTILGNLYGLVDVAGSEFFYIDGATAEEFDEVMWKLFFAGIFGSNRVPDIAALLLVEGKDRISGYTGNSYMVKECYDSLSTFALRALNSAPSSIRDQLIEIYLKRLSKMLERNGLNIRLDLRTIDGIRFDDLAKSVAKYKTKFDQVMENAVILANATPNSAPN